MKNSKYLITVPFLLFFMLCFVRTGSLSAQSIVNENDIKFTGTNTALVVGEDGLIMKTKDGGANWDVVTVPTTNVLHGNDFFNTSKGMAVGEFGTVLVTNDGGASWENRPTETTENLKDVTALEDYIWIACGDNGTILKTDDGGLTWFSIASGTANTLNDIKFVDALNGFIIGNNSTLLRTVDGGNTWESVNMGIGNTHLFAIDMKNSETGIVVGANGLILNTADGGITWFAPFSNPPVENIFDVMFLSDTAAIATGADGLIFKTIDGGFSWERIDIPFLTTTIDLKSVNFLDENIGISVGEEGTEIYTNDGGNTWLETPPEPFIALNNNKDYLPGREIPNSDNMSFEVKQNYPNPFNPATTITYILPFDSKVTVKVYDISGREICTLTDSYMNAGNQSVRFDASNLSSGVYFYCITASNGSHHFTRTMKMLLTK